MTAREALREASGSLKRAGHDDGERSALLLLQAALGLEGAALLAALHRPLPGEARGAYGAMVARARAGEPVQYILGRWDFYGFSFKTDGRALIPRPETELLVETALKALSGPAAVFDAGCGTGCIGITIKRLRPQASVTLGDVSPGALALARENAEALGADVSIVRADMRAPLPGGPWDVVVSNPPYISTAAMAALPPVVAGHEPALALHGGEDGMDFLRALAARAADSLQPGGRLFVEVGYDQGERAVALFAGAGMEAAAVADYSGWPRVIAARKGL